MTDTRCPFCDCYMPPEEQCKSEAESRNRLAPWGTERGICLSLGAAHAVEGLEGLDDDDEG